MSRIARRIAGIGASDLPDAVAFDAYVGPAREITVDPQRGIIALHDGVTPGGHRFRKSGDSDAANFATVAALLADNNTVIGYTGSGAASIVADGEIVTVQGFHYEVAAFDATDNHVETAGGVKLYVLPIGGVKFAASAFGVPDDGVTDATSALNLISNEVSANGGGVIELEAKTYFVAGTWEIPNNTTVVGVPGKTRILAQWHSESTGGYPNTIVTNDNHTGNSNIAFVGIIFDLAKPTSATYAVGAGLTMNNGLYFEKVSNLKFENCSIEHFCTNLDNTRPIADLVYFTAMLAVECSAVRITNLLLDDIREEGPTFLRCLAVLIDNVEGIGVTSTGGYNTSSFFAFWYCIGVDVANSHFIHRGGSVFNCCSSMVSYRGIHVERSSTGNGGAGFDFGNELDMEEFNPQNIIIDNCVLELDRYGVQIEQGTGFDIKIDGLSIRNCSFDINEAGGVLQGISVLEVVNGEVRNCQIRLGEAGAGTRGRAFRVFSCENFLIDSCYVNALNFVDVSGSFGVVGNLSIRNNDFDCQPIGSFAYADAAGCFIRASSTASSGMKEIRNLDCQKNRVNGVACILYSSINNADYSSWDHISFSDNTFVGPDGANMQRTMIMTVSGNGRRHLSFRDNTVIRGERIFLAGVKRIDGRNNILSWEGITPPTIARIQVALSEDLDIFWHGNLSVGVNSSYEAWQQTSSTTYRIVDIRDNCEINTEDATSYGKSTLPANTVLPN